MQNALQNDLNKEVIMLWHKDKDLSMFTKDDCIVLPGGFSLEITCVWRYCTLLPHDAKRNRVRK